MVGKKNLFLYKIFFILYFFFDIIYFASRILFFNPDVIHINPSLQHRALFRDSVYLLIAKAFRKKVVFFIHGWDTRLYSLFCNNKSFVKVIIRYILRKPDKIIVLAEKFKEQLTKLGVDGSKIVVLPIMVEYEKYKIKRSFNDKTIRVLFLANFFKDKGIYEVVKSILLVVNEFSTRKVDFILAGDGPEMQNIKKLVQDLEISNYVNFKGYVTGRKKIDVFRNADLFVYPTSHGEGFPTVIAEAMAAGLPIIATPVGAIPEVIEQGVNGNLLLNSEPKEIAEAVIYLLNNPTLMRNMRSKNREKAKQYGVTVVGKQLIQIYARIINS